MTKRHMTLFASAILLSFASSTFGAAMSTPDYKSSKEGVVAKYRAEKLACKQQAGNARDICIEQAEGDAKVSRAELEWNYVPSEKNANDLRVAKADAAFAVSKVKCGNLAGNNKEVCQREAESDHVTALADARVMATTADAKATAHAKAGEARADARADKRAAAFEVAKQKCGAMAGESKTQCLADANKMHTQLQD
jgi:hypothetical protein